MRLGSTGMLPAFVLFGTLLATGPAVAAEPTTSDCLTAHDSSLKFSSAHQLRAERDQLLICAAASCPTEIRKECLQRVEQVNLAIPSIIFEVKDGAGNDLSSVKVTLDGKLLAERLDGTALAIDPGEHRVVFETAGQAPVEKHFVIREAQKDRREAITIGPIPTPTSAAPAPAASPPVALGVTPTSTLSPPAAPRTVTYESVGDNGAAVRTLGYVLGGVGVVGIGIGAIFGLQMKSKISDRDTANACSADSSCTTADAAHIDQLTKGARSDSTISTISFVAGSGILVTGLVLVIAGLPSEPKSAHAIQMQPWVGTQTAGFGMGGVW
jgi:hypothetical protein